MWSGWDIDASLSFKRQSFGCYFSWSCLSSIEGSSWSNSHSTEWRMVRALLIRLAFLFSKVVTNYRPHCCRHYEAATSHWKLLSSAQLFVFVLYSGRSNSVGNAVFMSRCWKRGLLEGWPGARVQEIRTASPSLRHSQENSMEKKSRRAAVTGEQQNYLNTQNLLKVRVESRWLIHLRRLYICIFIRRSHLNTHIQIS